MNRYEIALDDGKGWYKKLGYIGPWSLGEITYYEDFLDALDLISEWGLNIEGVPRKFNKIGIYDHQEYDFYTQEKCFKILRSLNE